MPHSLRVFKNLIGSGYDNARALSVASVVEKAKTPPGNFDREQILDELCDAEWDEPLAEALADALRNCFASQKFSTHFAPVALKTALVRGGMGAQIAESFLSVLDASVATPRTAEIRAPIRHSPSPGRVVMCDFTHLKVPEMQKERRAIVVSSRTQNETGRCTVVPVSKLETNDRHPMNFRFEPGAYPFFHSTEPVWAICDHVYTVSLERLWKINLNRRPTLPQISREHLTAIRLLLAASMGIEAQQPSATTDVDNSPAGAT